MFDSTHICISNIKQSTFFTIISFPKKQTQPNCKLPLLTALSELSVFVLKSIFHESMDVQVQYNPSTKQAGLKVRVETGQSRTDKLN